MSDVMTSLQTDAKDHGRLARDWWTSLQPDGYREDRAAIARLRRALPRDAMAHDATLMLFRALGYSNHQRGRLPRVATLACILACVREDKKEAKFASAIGRTSFDDVESAALKPLRFQRLVTADSEDEIARSFRRALAIIGNTVNVADLARIILFFENDRTKQKLTFDYFGAGIAAPQDQPAI